MPYYRIYGKWFHLEYSHFFEEVIKSKSPRAAIIKLAKDSSGEERLSDVSWDKPPSKLIKVGLQETEPTFWVGADQLYQIRSIVEVKPAQIPCRACGGVGKTLGYEEVEVFSSTSSS